jgi:hypothetical protein
VAEAVALGVHPVRKAAAFTTVPAVTASGAV